MPEQEQTEPLADILANTGAEKTRRKAALVEALHGPPAAAAARRAREVDRIRWWSTAAFPSRQPPELEHDELVVRLAQLSRTFGARF
jgi:hypothetical protein